MTTTPAPAGLPGPLRCHGPLLEQRGWVYRYYPPYTHPVYPPGIPTLPAPRTMYPPLARTRAPRACTYGSFREAVGEPRGVEYSLVSGSQTGLYTVI